MTRSLLIGGDTPPRPATFKSWLVITWLPVLVMLIAIAIESTHAFSSDNTSGWIRSVFQAFSGTVTDERWRGIHHIIRKTGHFTGYGLMALAWMRAWLIFWWQPLIHRSRVAWRSYSLTLAIFCTALIASLDELHQSYMADRTGTMSDVLLDTTGAIVMLLVFLVIGRIARKAGQLTRHAP